VSRKELCVFSILSKVHPCDCSLYVVLLLLFADIFVFYLRPPCCSSRYCTFHVFISYSALNQRHYYMF